jgi:hypothetical protein
MIMKSIDDDVGGTSIPFRMSAGLNTLTSPTAMVLMSLDAGTGPTPSLLLWQAMASIIPRGAILLITQWLLRHGWTIPD